MHIDDGRVVPNFITQALRHEPLTVYGDGTQTRSFCYVDDLVDGIYRLLLSDEHEPVNIGNPQETTILQFAEIINRLTENPAGIRYEGQRTAGDPQRRQPNITRAKSALHWQPLLGLEEGLLRTIPYFIEQLRGADLVQ
jgi:dTDP-glucose 4,6-dehydratase